jgi:signal transduction histidine kinase
MVFHRFYRGNEAQRTGIRGTGIGWQWSNNRRAHGGEVSVISEPGAGSVFTFSIPVDTVECRASHSEDDPDIAQALEADLRWRITKLK